MKSGKVDVALAATLRQVVALRDTPAGALLDRWEARGAAAVASGPAPQEKN